MPQEAAWSSVAYLGLSFIELDPPQARAIAALRPLTRPLGLSLGDRACLALAQQLRRPALTAERSWARLDVGVEVRLIR
jgi:PIN domain nuclease of toxin-antitoxin system